MDWVANGESWNWRIRPVVMNPNANVVDAGYRFSALQAITLTAHMDLSDEFSQAGIPQLEQTAVRIVGSIYYGINSDANPSQTAMRILYNARVAVAQQVPDSLFTVETGAGTYDMNRHLEANEDFLWHYSDQFIIDTDYWADESILTPDWRAPQKVPVDIRVSRRLKQRETLALYFQAACTEVVHASGEFLFNPEASIRVWSDAQLRVLLRTIT